MVWILGIKGDDPLEKNDFTVFDVFGEKNPLEEYANIVIWFLRIKQDSPLEMSIHLLWFGFWGSKKTILYMNKQASYLVRIMEIKEDSPLIE